MVNKNALIPTESEEQILLFEWIPLQIRKYPELELIHSIPNGGKRFKKTAITLKKEGAKSGIPDIHLPIPKGIYHSLYIELKRSKGGKLSDNQKEVISLLKKYGNAVFVPEGFEVAADIIIKYLNLKDGEMLEINSPKILKC